MASLMPQATSLAPGAAARCLWALAKLSHHPGRELVEALTGALSYSPQPQLRDLALDAASDGPQTLPSDVPPSLSSDLTLPAAVDALWGLSQLKAPVPETWPKELSTRLVGR